VANKAKAIEKALKFIQKGQYDKAIQEYLGILKDDPNDVRILTKIGDLYQKSGKKDEAIKYYIKAADEYRKKGFETKAAAAYKQALELDPKRIDLHYKLAEFYANTGLIKDALRHYKNVVKLYELEGRLDKAVDILEKMVKLDPEDYTIKAKYVEALLAAGKTNQAEVRIPSVIEGFKLHHKLVDLAAFYEKLLNYKPGDVEILTDLADIYIQIGNPRKAINKLKQIYEAGKFTDKHFLLLARAYEMLGKKEKALHILKEALNEFRKDREKGRVIAERILELNPDDEDAKSFLGIKEEKAEELEVLVGEEEMLGEEEEEEAIVAEVETSGNEHFFTTNFDQTQPQVSGLMRRADVFLQNGLADKAIESLEEAIKMDPHNIDARAKLIEIYKRVNPKGAVPHLIALAEISDSLGDVISAREYAEEALRIDPSNKLAQEKVEQYSWGGEEEESLDMVIPADDSEILGETEIGLDEEVVKSGPAGEEKIPSSVLEDLSDAEFFADQGLLEEAINIYEKVLKEHPELEEVREKYEKLKKNMEEKAVTDKAETVTQSESSVVTGTGNPGTTASEEVIEDAEVIEDVEEVGEIGEEEKIDLRELIGEKLPEEKGGAGFDVPSLEDTIKAFKEGVKKELGDADSSAHYDLGIAYKEMGLYDDAIEEFRIAAKDPERFVEAATMIGLCYRDKGDLDEAMKWFLKALKSPDLSEEAYLELNYELGKIFEAKGDLKRAVYFYKNVLEKNKKYRDIIERIKAIKEKILKSRS